MRNSFLKGKLKKWTDQGQPKQTNKHCKQLFWFAILLWSFWFLNLHWNHCLTADARVDLQPACAHAVRCQIAFCQVAKHLHPCEFTIRHEWTTQQRTGLHIHLCTSCTSYPLHSRAGRWVRAFPRVGGQGMGYGIWTLQYAWSPPACLGGTKQPRATPFCSDFCIECIFRSEILLPCSSAAAASNLALDTAQAEPTSIQVRIASGDFSRHA